MQVIYVTVLLQKKKKKKKKKKKNWSLTTQYNMSFQVPKIWQKWEEVS